jgi:hypothetical protein
VWPRGDGSGSGLAWLGPGGALASACPKLEVSFVKVRMSLRGDAKRSERSYDVSYRVSFCVMGIFRGAEHRYVNQQLDGCGEGWMINRRRTIRVILAALPTAWLLWPDVACADQAFQRFLPFLVDLDGWQGKKPEGFSMETSGTSMISATREYARGPAHLQVQVISGAAAQGALAATRTGMNFETGDGRMNTSTIDGLPVTRSFNNKDQSGAILVALGTEALLSVSFNGIGDDDALILAKKFNWKAIQAAAQVK